VSTAEDLFQKGKHLLEKMPQPSLEARILLCKSASIQEEEFLKHPEILFSQAQVDLYYRLIEKRLSGVPLAYMTGSREFWSESFQVQPGVLIPRPETELIVEKIIELSSGGNEVIVDIGTGCGNIALSVAKELPDAEVIATDISQRALRTARLNALELNRSRVAFIHGSVCAPLRKLKLENMCDFIVSNPPYVSRKEWESLDREIREHEPKRALVPGETGLEMIATLVRGAPEFLKTGGYLLVEIGYGQKGAVGEMFESGWSHVEFSDDLAGIPRVVSGRKQ
jgi:release factor glutamine methyltransferase